MQERGFAAANADFSIVAPASVAAGSTLTFKLVSKGMTIAGFLIKTSAGKFQLLKGEVRTPGTCTGADVDITVTHDGKRNVAEQTLNVDVPATATGTITLNGVFLTGTDASNEVFHPVSATVTVTAASPTSAGGSTISSAGATTSPSSSPATTATISKKSDSATTVLSLAAAAVVLAAQL